MPVPTHIRARPLRLAVAAAAAVLALGLSACGDDGGDSATDDERTTTSADRTTTTQSGVTTSTSTDGTTTTSAPTSAGSAEEQEIIDRYVGYWGARTAANTGTPNPADPALAEYATGEQLDTVVAETQANLDNGLAFRQPEDPANFREVRVALIDGDTAVVQECVVDDGLVIRRGSGEIVNDRITTQNVRGELRRVDGRWRLARTSLIQSWEGIAGCAVSG